MKKLLVIFASLALALGAFAAEKKERTIKGTGLCAKCALSMTDSCTNAVQTKNKEGKTMTYLLTTKDDHGKYFCKGKTENMIVKGTVERKDGKLMLTPSSIKVKDS